ncbi:translation initiation factor eIF-2B subunit delta isoform X2 [Ixodes scapularis]|nr:translation initiation factor eIF-2B subunit delta isoform X2 [Ixodes scapularis]
MESLQQEAAHKKKPTPQKRASTHTKESQNTRKNKPIPVDSKAQNLCPAVDKKESTQPQTNSGLQSAKADLKVTPSEQGKLHPEPQVEVSAKKKKNKKKKKKKPKNPPTDPQPESQASAPSTSVAEAGCCSLKNLKDVSCLELICPHSNKHTSQAFSSAQKSATATSSAKCSSSSLGNSQLHFETLSDAIVKSLASLDKTSISITLVNPENGQVVGEKVVHGLREQTPLSSRDSELVIDICGTSVVELDDRVSFGGGSGATQGTSMKASVENASKKSSKKNKDCNGPQAVAGSATDGRKQQQTKPTGESQKLAMNRVEVSEVLSKGDAASAMQAEPTVKSAAKEQETGNDANSAVEKTKAQLKAERRAAFEAQKAAQLVAQKNEEKEAGGKSKADLRAERRALQEAQRAAKMQTAVKPGKEPGSEDSAVGTPAPPKKAVTGQASSDANVEGKASRQDQPQDAAKKVPKKSTGEARKQKELHLLSHLEQNPGTVDHLRSYGLSGSQIHPAVLRIGLQMAEGVVTGSNRRCTKMLCAFRSVIRDYTCHANKRISQDIREQLDCDIKFLKKCRPLSVSMQNAITFLKGQISEIQDTEAAEKVKEKLVESIDKFIYEELCLAKKQITYEAQKKILHGDVILTYSSSSLVKSVLKTAHESGTNFRVVIADSRPKLEGREMCDYLSGLGINCTYILINAVSYIMREVTKVMLGAHSLLANGYVMSRIGTSQIALVAKAKNVPVLVCCETYKFSERVHTDSFVSNELGATAELLTSLPPDIKVDDLKDSPSLTLLNLMYDVTPPQFVDMVITEKGILPCTSVPVVLRMRNAAGQ